MSFVANAITGELGLDASPQVKAIKQAVTGAKEYRDAMHTASQQAETDFKKHARETEGAAKEMAEKIKQSLGKRSAFGEWTEILAGGGALMGLNMAAQEMGEMVTKMGELNQQLAEGKINAFDMAEGIAKSIPVFGQFYSLGREIRDFFTGEKADMEETKRIVDEQNAALEERNKIIKEGRAAQKQFNDELRTLDQQVALLHAPNQDAKEALAADQDAANAKKKAQDDYKEKGLDPLKERKKEFDNLDKDLKEKQAELADLPAPFTLHGGKQEFVEDLATRKAAQGEIDDLMGKRRAAFDEYQKQKKIEGDLAKDAAAIGVKADEIAAAKKAEIAQRPAEAAKAAAKKAEEDWEAARRKLAEPVIDAKKQADQMGMTEGQRKMDDLRREAGAHPGLISEKELAMAKQVFDGYDAAVKNKALDERVKALREAIETPADKFNKAVADMREELAAGKITQGEFSLGQAKARTDAFGDSQDRRSALIRRGSAESQALAYDGGRGVQSIAEKTLAAHEKTNDLLGQMLSGQQDEVPDTIVNSNATS